MDWTASWIWHPPKADMDNLYVYARRTFDLADVPPGARAFVTAGSLYKLYVNGRYVGRGPNPSDPSRYYYDVHPLAKFLRPGKNVVAAVCYNYGAETKGILGQNWGRGGSCWRSGRRPRATRRATSSSPPTARGRSSRRPSGGRTRR